MDMPALYTSRIKADAEDLARQFCESRYEQDYGRDCTPHKRRRVDLPAKESTVLVACVLDTFVKSYSYSELSAFLDANYWAAQGLQAISFTSCPDIAMQLVAAMLNSEQCTGFKMVIVPQRAKGLSVVAANRMSATLRANFVRVCLESMTVTSANHAVPNLIDYLENADWYRRRGSVQDGCRWWKLWRHVTSPDTQLSKDVRYVALRAFLSTCPGPLFIKGSETPLSMQADAEAVRTLLNPPQAELLPEGIALAQKVGRVHITAAAIIPGAKTAMPCYVALKAKLSIDKIQTPVFRWLPPDQRQNCSEFMLLLARQDHRNGCLLALPHDVANNENTFMFYCNLLGQFENIVHHGPGEHLCPVWNVCPQRLRSVERTALLFATCAFVGIFGQRRRTLVTIDAFFSFSKRVTLGSSPGLTLWEMLWQPHSGTLCLAQSIGVEAIFGPRWVHNMCPDDVFKVLQGIASVFATNPYLDIAQRARHFDLVPAKFRSLRVNSIKAIIALHHRHPDIGPQKGVYKRPSSTECLNVLPQARKPLKMARHYVRRWLLPKFKEVVQSIALGRRCALAYMVPGSRKAQIIAWAVALRRAYTRPKNDIPYLSADIQQLIFSLCI